jgi:SAM-dependent methyltransferase
MQPMVDRAQRTPEQLRHHYLVETELANRLRRATRSERRNLYTQVYDELCRRVPDHPSFADSIEPSNRLRQIDRQLRLIRRFFTPGFTFLEVGPGDCRLAVAVAHEAKHVYAVDVATELPKATDYPPNFVFRVSDGSSVPVPPGTIDIAYSNQVMEHIHPEDAREQLRNIFAALKPGGRYICTTPHRFKGPHDISKYFDDVATGLHLKEYTVIELARAFREAGFRSVQVLSNARGWSLLLPPLPATLIEGVLIALPRRLQQRAASLPIIGGLLGIRLVATK